MECGPMDVVITSASPKQSYRSLRNSKMYHGKDFRPPGQIRHVSLKGFWRRVLSCHNKRTMTRIEKPSAPTDLERQNIDRGTPSMSVEGSEVMPCHDFIN